MEKKAVGQSMNFHMYEVLPKQWKTLRLSTPMGEDIGMRLELYKSSLPYEDSSQNNNMHLVCGHNLLRNNIFR